MNLYKKKIYKSSLQHSGLPKNPRRNHKYLYIDANGRYVYPDDVKNGGHSSGSQTINPHERLRRKLTDQLGYGFGTTASEKAFKDVQKSHRDSALDQGNKAKTLAKKAVTTSDNNMLSESKKYLKRAYKNQNMSLGKKSDDSKYINDKRIDKRYDKASSDVRKSAFNKSMNQYEKDRAAEDERKNRRAVVEKEADRNRKREQQRKAAHAGYEEDRKKFPEGGSTEELERQKEKKFLKDRAIAREARRSMRTTGTTAEIEGAKRAAQKRKRDDLKDGPGVAGTDEMYRQMENTKIRKTEKANLERRRKQKKAKSETPVRTISGVSTTTKSPTKKSRTSSVTVETTQPKQKNETAYERQHRERAESTKAGNKKLRKTGGDLTRAWMKSKFGGSVVDSVDTLKDTSDKSKKKKKKVAKK